MSVPPFFCATDRERTTNDVKLYADDTTFLAPRAATWVSASVHNANVTSEAFVNFSKKLFVSHELVWSSCLVSLRDSKTALWIANLTNERNIIPCGICLGKLSEIPAVHALLTSENEWACALRCIYSTGEDTALLKSVVNDSSSSEQKEKIITLLRQYESPFDFSQVGNSNKSSATSRVRHRIDTTGHSPVNLKPYRTSLEGRNTIANEI